jgi:hypothetical protein
MTAFGEALPWVPWNLCFGAILCAFLLIGSGPWRKLVAASILDFPGIDKLRPVSLPAADI